MRVYAVGIFVTKYKYNNAWLNNSISDADLINFHVILSLITTRQASSRFRTNKTLYD